MSAYSQADANRCQPHACLYLHCSACFACFRTTHAEAGVEECRSRYQELTGETLPGPPPLPDVSELIPDGPEDLDLASLLAELETSFD